MKKLLTLTVVIAALSFTTKAQETGIGAKAGVNIATLSGDDVENADSKIGVHVGGFFQFMLSDKFGIQPELLYSDKGASAEEDEGGDLTLSYLSVPIMAKIFLTEGLDIHVGPQVGILLSADNDGNDISDFTNTTDFGVGAGLGYTLDSGFGFNARYVMGLTSVYEDDLDFDAKNSVIQISLSYNFLQ
jgi:hypothetical protein